MRRVAPNRCAHQNGCVPVGEYVRKKHIENLSIENRLELMEAHQMVGRALGKGSYWTSPSPPGIDSVPPRG